MSLSQEVMFVKPLQQFAARTKDAKTLRHSSSGGMSTELSRCILRRGGVVVGAAFAKDFSVEHICVEDEKDLQRIVGSKYCVSRVGPAIKKIEASLNQGRDVLFFGTPCQTAAIRKRFGVVDHLYVCAIFCHSNVPGDIWKGYLQDLEKSRGTHVTAVVFRDKCSGWNEATMRIGFENSSKDFSMPLYSNTYMQLFFSGWATQECCFHCAFRHGNHGADLMIGDFWGVENVVTDWNDDSGASAVLCYTEKGSALLKNCDIHCVTVKYEDILAKNPGMELSPTVDPVARGRFEKVRKKCGILRAYRYAKYGPLPYEMCISGCVRCRSIISRVLRKVGLK